MYPKKIFVCQKPTFFNNPSHGFHWQAPLNVANIYDFPDMTMHSTEGLFRMWQPLNGLFFATTQDVKICLRNGIFFIFFYF